MNSTLSRLLRGFLNSPYLLLTLTTLFWAGNMNVGRYAAGYVPPVALGTLRWIGAAALLLPFAWPHLRRDWPVIRRHAPFLLLLSVLSISAYNTLTYFGLQFTEVINAVILQATGPLFMIAFAFLLFGERIGVLQLIGLIVSVAGVTVIVSRGELETLLGLELNLGDFVLIAAIASYSVYSVLLRKRPPLHSMSFVWLTMAWGAAALLPFWIAEAASGLTVPLEPAAFLIVAYVVIFPSLAAHFFFFRGVELIGSNRAAPMLYLIPVFASAIAILALGEPLHLFHILGFMLVIGGVAIATRQPAAAPAPIVKT